MLQKKIRLIKAGQGDKAFYPKEVLMRDGGKAFPKGTRLLDTHILANPNNQAFKQGVPASALVGTTTEDARYERDGLYANAVIYSDYATLIKEKSDAIGLSIFASAKLEDEEGIITAVELIPSPFNSVDVVVHTKAGGGFISESAEFDSKNLESVYFETEKFEEDKTAMTVEDLRAKLEQFESKVLQLQKDIHIKDRLLNEFQIRSKISDALSSVEFISEEAKELVKTSIVIQSLADETFDPAKIDSRMSNYIKGNSELVRQKKPIVAYRNSESYQKYPIVDNPAVDSSISLEKIFSEDFKF